jgi:hypothetical protein
MKLNPIQIDKFIEANAESIADSIHLKAFTFRQKDTWQRDFLKRADKYELFFSKLMQRYFKELGTAVKPAALAAAKKGLQNKDKNHNGNP